MNRLIAAAAFMLWSIAAVPAATAATAWIDAATARAALASGADVVVIDARGGKDYAAGHVAGALNAPWQSFADMNGKPGDPGWGTLKAPDKLAQAIGALGIGPSTKVIVYSGSPKGWGEDGRVAWTLASAGVADVAILDGGYEGWVKAGGATTAANATPIPKSFAVAALDAGLNATKAEVVAAVGKARIIDARAGDEYAGARKYGEARGGHLPGAVNIPWDQVFDADGRLRDRPALEAIFAKAGIGPNDEIIAYCTKGIRSAHMALVLRQIGYAKARNYDGSFHEWAGDKALPLE